MPTEIYILFARTLQFEAGFLHLQCKKVPTDRTSWDSAPVGTVQEIAYTLSDAEFALPDADFNLPDADFTLSDAKP